MYLNSQVMQVHRRRVTSEICWWTVLLKQLTDFDNDTIDVIIHNQITRFITSFTSIKTGQAQEHDNKNLKE